MFEVDGGDPHFDDESDLDFDEDGFLESEDFDDLDDLDHDRVQTSVEVLPPDDED